MSAPSQKSQRPKRSQVLKVSKTVLEKYVEGEQFPKKIAISTDALNTMIISCIEVTPYETYGLCFGKKLYHPKQQYHPSIENMELEYHVTSCVPMQDTEKKYTEVCYEEEKVKIMKSIGEKNNLVYLGDYHSHTRARKNDFALLELNPIDANFKDNLITVIIAVNKLWKRHDEKKELDLANKKYIALYNIPEKNGKKIISYKVELCVYGLYLAKKQKKPIAKKLELRIVD